MTATFADLGLALTFTDLFCGAGGSIGGMANAGFRLVLGANHDARSIETVSTNYRDADFLCVDINHYDMRALPKTQVLWASVICTEMSPAGGNRKHRGQLGFEELGHVKAPTYERTRACALDVIRATEVHRYDAVIVENVVEFARDWELYDWWVEGMCRLRPGYNVQTVNVSAAHVYGEGNDPAPQWRDRIYIVFTKKGIPLPDLEPRPPSWCEACDGLVEGVQTWKRLDRRRVGKYGQQYVYRCPRDSSVVEPLVLPAAAALDLSNIGTRIGDRARPLGTKTRARVQWGIDTFVQPVVAQVAGNTFERPGYHRVRPAHQAPLTARTGTGQDALVTPSMLVNTNHDDSRVFPAGSAPFPSRTTRIGDMVVSAPFVTMARKHGQATSALDEPLATVTTSGHHHYLTTPPAAVPWVTMLRGPDNRPTGVDEPLATVTTGRNHYLTTPPDAFIAKAYGGNARPEHLVKPVTDPLGTITTRDHHYLVVPYRKGARPRPAAAAPLQTVTTTEAHGLAVAPGPVEVDDCYYRMLTPREHARGQRFADDYVITGNIGEQTLQVGNAVPCNAAQWIGTQLIQVLEAGA